MRAVDADSRRPPRPALAADVHDRPRRRARLRRRDLGRDAGGRLLAGVGSHRRRRPRSCRRARSSIARHTGAGRACTFRARSSRCSRGRCRTKRARWCPARTGLTVTVEMTVSGQAVRQSAFYRSVIRSDERLTYDQVDRIFAGSERAGDAWGAGAGGCARVRGRARGAGARRTRHSCSSRPSRSSRSTAAATSCACPRSRRPSRIG